MARPKKNNADYFSHDSGMRNDEKIKALRRKYGLEGYAIWCMFLEKLTDCDNFEIKLNFLAYELMGGDFEICPERLKEILEYCINIELLINNEGIIYSGGLKERLQGVLDKRNKMSELANKRWGKEKIKRNVSHIVRGEVFKRDLNKCVKCDSSEELEIDHIKELCNGGTNDIENLQLLCKKCHTVKTKELYKTMRTHEKTNAYAGKDDTCSMQSKVNKSKVNKSKDNITIEKINELINYYYTKASKIESKYKALTDSREKIKLAIKKVGVEKVKLAIDNYYKANRNNVKYMCACNKFFNLKSKASAYYEDFLGEEVESKKEITKKYTNTSEDNWIVNGV